jgi:two-component system response regulator FlrC
MSVLVVGNLGGFFSEASDILLKKGHQISQADGIEQALSVMRKGFSPEMILVDVAHDIPKFIGQLGQERFSTHVVACGSGVIDKDVIKTAIKAGAEEFVPFPPDPEMIADILDSFHKTQHSLLYRDKAMRDCIKMADKVAASDATVLITGESGTGKEMMARYIHDQSARSKKVFLSVNCAAIPENLLESELFGHEKGAFTGAIARRIGKFEAANGGTLFLDEITEMHPRLQAKLLRAIQEREIDRVGGGSPVPVNFRLIATSNRDMQDAIDQGQFREDLYYRLSVICVNLPPLRERPEDVIPLAHFFIDKYTALNGIRPIPTLKEDAEDFLKKHLWPGNVRELENMMHRAVLLSEDGEITKDHLGLKAVRPENVSGHVKSLVGKTLASVEKALIVSTLERCDQDRSRAAQLLGLSLKALREKLDLYEDHLREQEAKTLS